MFKIIAGIGLVQILAIAVNLGRAKALALLLGPHGVGVVSVIDQVVQFTTYLSAFSLPLAAVKFLSRAHCDGQAAFHRTYAGFLALLAFTSTAGASLLASLALLRPHWLGTGLEELGGTVAVAALSLPAMTLLGYFTNVLAAARRTRVSASMALVTNAALTAGACAGLLWGSIRGLYCGTAAMNLALVAGTLFYLRRSMQLSLRVRLRELAGEFRRNRNVTPYAFCLGIAASSYSIALLAGRTALLQTDATAAGLLQAVLSLSGAIGLALNPANGLFLTPLMNRGIAPAEKARAALEFHRKLLFLLGAGGLVIVLFPAPIIRLLFSGAFAAAAPHVFWFVLAQCILQLAGVYQALLIGLDDLPLYAAISCGSYLAMAGLCRWLGPSHGIAGIGYAFFVGSALLLAGTLLRAQRRFSVTVPAALHAMTLFVLAGLLLAGMVANRTVDGELGIVPRVGIGIPFLAFLPCWMSREERRALLGYCRKLLPA